MTQEDGNSIQCRWNDDHEAIFTEQWLQDRRFTKENSDARKLVARDNPQLIGSDVNFPRESFEDVLKDDRKLLSMLEIFSKMGVFLLEGAPLKEGQLKILADRIGFIRPTHYGYENQTI